MKRLLLDGSIRILMSEYSNEVNADGTAASPSKRLEKLKGRLSSAKQKKYVQAIVEHWEELTVATADEIKDRWIPLFNGIIPYDRVSSQFFYESYTKKDGSNGRKRVSFYKSIITAMQYRKVQSQIYPHYMSRLRIKTCVYCNAQYSFSIGHYINYELDHVLPKSKYPFLCTTFTNLQPCCSTCNRLKGDKEEDEKKSLFRLFTSDKAKLNPMLFQISKSDLMRYWIAPSNGFKLVFSCPGNPSLENGQNEFFGIQALYEAHMDIAEEIVWKKKVYTPTLIESYRCIFKNLNLTNSQLNRFIMGNYGEEQNIHMRPLSKMTQDLARQLGLANYLEVD